MVVGLSLQDCLSREERDLKRILLVYLSVSATGWLVTFCYQFYPSLFVRLNVVCLLCFVLPSIFFYRIVRFLTRLGEPEEFPPLHYLVPGLLALAMLVWSCFVPFDVRLEIVRGKAEVIPAGYEWYTRFFTLKPLLRVVFGLLYYILTLALLVSYYKRARGKDTLVRGPAGWVIFLVGVSIASLLSSVLPTFMPRSRFYYSLGRQSCLAASPSNTFCYRTMSYGGNTASTSCAVNPRLLPPEKRMRETCASAVVIPGN